MEENARNQQEIKSSGQYGTICASCAEPTFASPRKSMFITGKYV